MNDFHNPDYDQDYDASEDPELPESMPEPISRARVVNDLEIRKIEAMVKLAELGHAELIPDLLAALTGSNRCETPSGDPAYRVSHHSTPKLDAAKAKAQGTILAARINRQNDHLKNKYADINAVLEASMKACSEAGLAVTQTPWVNRQGQLILTTRLACDGEWIEGDLAVRIEAQKGVNNKQAGGIALTYIRRYALNAMLNIPSGDDNDGDEGAFEPDDRPAPKQNKWQVAVKAFASVGVKPPAMLAYLGRSTVNEVDDDDHEKLQELFQGLKAGDAQAKAALAKAQK